MKQVGGHALSYLSVARGRPPAFYESGRSTTKRYRDMAEYCTAQTLVPALNGDVPSDFDDGTFAKSLRRPDVRAPR